MIRALILVLLLAACDGSDGPKREPVNPSLPWEIGPIIDGRNYSHNLPTHVADPPAFTFGLGAEPHYVTKAHGPLAGKSVIRMRYRISFGDGTLITGKGCESGSDIVLYFQSGSNWFKDGGRWWFTTARGPLEKGEHEIVAPLDGNWTSVEAMSAENNPAEFSVAKANASRVGFTFSNCEGQGHGAVATGLVEMEVIEFEVN